MKETRARKKRMEGGREEGGGRGGGREEGEGEEEGRERGRERRDGGGRSGCKRIHVRTPFYQLSLSLTLSLSKCR